ncbi:hypothetical protein A6S26_17555 [Nostoc sp. ATCC 43529]|nr:hypothetical protein A6S26_17555 [Nostoc sp. ATCC 43529]
MKINLGITKFMIFCIGAYILIPKIVGYVGVFSAASASSLNSNDSNTLIARKVNSPDFKDTYIPPNYGGPDSQHGSGTR